jgi:hypothetical protein
MSKNGMPLLAPTVSLPYFDPDTHEEPDMSIKRFSLTAVAIGTLAPLLLFGQSGDTLRNRQVAIEWPGLHSRGRIEVANGRCVRVELVRGAGKVDRDSFALSSDGDARLLVSVSDVKESPGSGPTIVTVRTERHPFSFFLRDVSAEYPIYIPEYHVVVTTSGDTRLYCQVEAALRSRHGKTRLQQIEDEPEETFESAAPYTRNQPCPTWLGLSRDMRIFELSDNLTNPGSEMNTISPRNASSPVTLPESDARAIYYSYMAGRGQGVATATTRRLEEGVLPILHSTLIDGDIEYRSTAFVSLERAPLTSRTPIGTDFLVADAFSGGHMFTREQTALVQPRLASEAQKSETTVLYYRNEATNTGAVPRYAWFKTTRPDIGGWKKVPHSYNGKSGFSSFTSGRVFGISRFNGEPLPDEEIAVLLKPGEKGVFEFMIPHTPLPEARARDLARQSFDERYEGCRRFWREKLESAARVQVPDRRINEMIKAGLLQLDVTTYGNEPGGTLAPTIGAYSPIGTESSPIIHFYNSMGWEDAARRCLAFFLDKQHADGMMQNFGGYMVETGAVLWSMGEYARYTGDREWVRQVAPQVLKATRFLLRWRREQKNSGAGGQVHGLIAGKVADPEDPFHQYMLNAYGYLGISRASEMLKEVDPDQSQMLAREADAWKQDIRASLMESIARAPVVPLGDGRWSPTVAPWAEAIGPRALHAAPGSFFSHGTVTVPDELLGPLSLVFCEVLPPGEEVSTMMLEYQSELFLERNAAFSQPYYSRHDWLQLTRGMVKPFLKSYFNMVSALADRDTYTFWEHTYQVSAHKTHEQAWFLMETRWMLYLEEGETLKLLSGIPRSWMEEGKKIVLESVRSYFGPLSLEVLSRTEAGYIEATISCESSRRPKSILIRFPHPGGKKARRVTGGTYEPGSESVLIKDFTGRANVRVDY